MTAVTSPIRAGEITLTARVGIRADPRSWLLLVVATNALVLSGGPFWVTLVAQAILLLLVASLRRPRLLQSAVVWFVLSSGSYLLLPRLWPNGWSVGLAFFSFWIARFAVSIVLGICVFVLVRPSELVAALSRLRVPPMVTIPLAVLFRFLPLVRSEFKAVVDAMSLRGLRPGAGMLARPLQSLEYILVPLLASCSRIADDLSASALVRGLGGPNRPTSIARIGFGLGDLLIWLVIAILLLTRIVMTQ